jgi:hypothetical protein
MKIAKIPNLNFDASPAALSQSVNHLKDIENVEQRSAVIQALSKSISTIWIVMTPILGAGFIMVLFVRKYSLKRTVVQAGDKKDIEKGNEVAVTAESSSGNDDSASQETRDMKGNSGEKTAVIDEMRDISRGELKD